MAKSKTLVSVVGFIAILFFVLSLTVIAPSTTLANPEEQGAVKAEEQATPPAEQPTAPPEQAAPPAEEPAPPAVEQPAPPAAGQQESTEVININTAGEQDLLKLKRIGPDLAKRIIAYREKKGPFKKTEDILKVKGLGGKFWKANKDRMTVGEGVTEEKKEEPAPQPSGQPESTPPEAVTPPPSQEAAPAAEGQTAPQGEQAAPPAETK
ncbi:MAG: helix-hairpin-helix domain-containing protein [bacterium]